MGSGTGRRVAYSLDSLDGRSFLSVSGRIDVHLSVLWKSHSRTSSVCAVETVH